METSGLDLEQLRTTLVMVLDHAGPMLDQYSYRLVGTAAALLQGVQLPARDVDILVKERPAVDAIGAALAAFRCLEPPSYLTEARQYYGNYEVNGVEVGISTVEWETTSDGIECLGRGPWEHYCRVPCGPYTVPAVALELRLVSELGRERPGYYLPLIQHMRAHGCDVELVRRGLAARGFDLEQQEEIIRQLAREKAKNGDA
jgi:hypothetical protein